MVIEFVVGVVVSILTFFLGLLPSFSLPSWLTGLPSTATTVGGYVGQFSVWIPIDEVLVVLAFILIALGVSLAVRVTRMAISHFTGGGGSVS